VCMVDIAAPFGPFVHHDQPSMQPNGHPRPRPRKRKLHQAPPNPRPLSNSQLLIQQHLMLFLLKWGDQQSLTLFSFWARERSHCHRSPPIDQGGWDLGTHRESLKTRPYHPPHQHLFLASEVTST
jgi:hypothetical protein